MQDEVTLEAAKTGALIGYRVLVFLMLLALLAKKPAAIEKPAPNLTGEVSRQVVTPMAWPDSTSCGAGTLKVFPDNFTKAN